ncbi:MAG TPA: ribosomal RNA small subunit methyltransferase A [Fastidiosipila sp.]|nr:ribosomal RNA small subunit methyltransferase A [Fastidiosipila sp.]
MKEKAKANSNIKSELLSLLRQQSFSPRRSLGQNFLVDRAVFDRIIEQLNPDKKDALVEIGMGPGLLSRELAEKAGFYLGCEIDQRFASMHAEIFSDLDLNAQFLYEDALEIDFESYSEQFAEYERLLVFSNLPYYITTDLILKMVCSFPQAEQMLFMLEKAALKRVLAQPSTKPYGPLSIITSLWGKWEEVMTVPAQSFEPAPHTTSSLYALISKPESEYTDAAASCDFQEFTKDVLGNRRKTLANALMYTKIQGEQQNSLSLSEFLNEEKLAANVRAESLTAKQFVRLYSRLVNAN